ncbi:MAG: hypothetical protein QOI36_5894 [Pseudonocardiales bacterium]|nr:hypothetical protein [Pseudonocardia sp.]MDT7654488.1 hypothetical protein [Pseudonocardiales bacterium]
MAGASFVLIERPILAGRGWQLQPRRTLTAAGTALVVTGCSVLVPLATGPPPVSQLVDNPRDDDLTLVISTAQRHPQILPQPTPRPGDRHAKDTGHLGPSHQAEPAGCRVAALSRFQTLIAAIDTSSDESSFSS